METNNEIIQSLITTTWANLSDNQPANKKNSNAIIYVIVALFFLLLLVCVFFFYPFYIFIHREPTLLIKDNKIIWPSSEFTEQLRIIIYSTFTVVTGLVLCILYCCRLFIQIRFNLDKKLDATKVIIKFYEDRFNQFHQAKLDDFAKRIISLADSGKDLEEIRKALNETITKLEK